MLLTSVLNKIMHTKKGQGQVLHITTLHHTDITILHHAKVVLQFRDRSPVHKV